MLEILLILVVTILNIGTGMLWYSQKMFGKSWIELQGFSKEEMAKANTSSMKKTLLIAFAKTLIMTLVLLFFIILTDTDSFISGIVLGLLLCIGFVMPAFLDSVLWERRPLKLFFINSSYYAVVIALSGGLLSIFQ
ncbi:DUF1761 domain-containing protein [bacterium]